MASPRGDASAAESIILEEEIDENYEPSEEGACFRDIPPRVPLRLHSRKQISAVYGGHKRKRSHAVPTRAVPTHRNTADAAYRDGARLMWYHATVDKSPNMSPLASPYPTTHPSTHPPLSHFLPPYRDSGLREMAGDGPGVGGRGLHSSTSQLNLSCF